MRYHLQFSEYSRAEDSSCELRGCPHGDEKGDSGDMDDSVPTPIMPIPPPPVRPGLLLSPESCVGEILLVEYTSVDLEGLRAGRRWRTEPSGFLMAALIMQLDRFRVFGYVGKSIQKSNQEFCWGHHEKSSSLSCSDPSASSSSSSPRELCGALQLVTAPNSSQWQPKESVPSSQITPYLSQDASAP